MYKMPSQQQPQLQEHQTPKIVDDEQCSKELQQQKQNQQPIKKTQHQQENSSTHNLNNNNNNNNSNSNNNNNKNINNKFNMEKNMRKPMEKCNTTLLSASTQLLKEATVAALLQRNKQCSSTISTTSCSDASNASFSSASVADSAQDDMSDQCSLTQAGLEEYNIRASSYYDQPVLFHHQKQSSYAQSEGYHSYVSSSDSSSATPFLDRLRQESEMLSRQSSHHWSQNDLSSVSCASAAPSPIPSTILLSTVSVSNGDRADELHGENDIGTTGDNQQQQQQQAQHRLQQHGNNNTNNTNNIPSINNNNNTNTNSSNSNNNNNSSESTSSTETLKWLGSMSDVSEASHATGYSAVSESVSNSQLIVHSSRVLTPKRHHSESVLYLNTEQHQRQISPHISPTGDPNQQSPPMYHQQSNLQRDNHITTRTGVNHRHSPSYPPIHSTLSLQPYHQHYYQQQQQKSPSSWTGNEFPSEISNSSLIVNKLSSTASPSSLPCELDKQQSISKQQQQDIHKSSISVTISNSEAVVTISPQTPTSITTKTSTDKTTNDERESTNSTSAPGDEPKMICSTASSVLGPLSVTTAAYRSNHRLFPVSTYTEHSNTSQFVLHPKPQYSAGLQKPTGISQMPNTPSSSSGQLNNTSPKSLPQPQANSWHSVAELINDFERTKEQQPQKYAFMDPNKTQRISNPALKAFQKNAVQSYFERQQQQHQHSKEKSVQQYLQPPHSQQQQQQQQILRPHSFQASASAKEINTYELLRNSLPNTYNRHQQLSPKQQHQHQQQQSQQQLKDLSLLNDTRRLSSSLSGIQMHASSHQEFNLSTTMLKDDTKRKPSSPEPPPPPPRSRSLMPISVLRRSSSASDYAEFREQYKSASQDKLQAQSIKNISSSEKSSFNDCGMPPAPPPRGRIAPPERRTSSASEYAAMRDKYLLQQAAARAHQQHHPNQYVRQPTQRSPNNTSYQYAPRSTPTSSSNGWVPERPPKNPNLRVPSPDLPPPPTDIDGNLLGSDEPLPPPPPEILHRQIYYDMSTPSQSNISPSNTSMLNIELTSSTSSSPNRRNSFAGSTNRKTYYNSEMSSKAPPMIPKKPANIENFPHPSAALSVQQNQQSFKSKAQPQMHSSSVNQNQLQNQNRKRPHNPGVILNVPPIPENVSGNMKRNDKSVASSQPILPAKPAPPLPLKPRTHMSSHSTGATPSMTAVQMRCNSKASYLPRQSLEKLNNSDPDHGSYKLTLTSNEDLVNTTNTSKPSASSYDILVGHNGKIPNNLPDVLPLGAKFQQPHPASPTGGKMSPLRYSFGSNSSISSSQQLPSQMYPLQHRYSTPTMGSSNVSTPYHLQNNPHPPSTSYLRSQSYDNELAAGSKTTKYMSQSTIDLKSTRIQTLDTTHEEECSPNVENTPTHMLSPAQSENNISNVTTGMGHISGQQTSLSSSSSTNNNNNNNGSYSSSDGRIFRAELVSTTLPNSPSLGSGNSLNKTVTRKDSLRENIEKITQLQSQLMSAHLSDPGFALSGYGVKSATKSNTASLEKLPSGESTPIAPNQENKQETNDDTNTTTIHILGNKSTGVKEESNNSFETTVTVSPPKSTVASPSLVSTNSPKQTSPTPEKLSPTNESKSAQNPDTPPIQCEDGGLKLIQRSEIVLRVNPTMVEASSQTDDLTEADDEILRTALPQQLAKETQSTRTTLQPRQRHPIELDCDKMCEELATLLPSNDKLINIILPQGVKSASDYVNDLYNPNVPLRPTKHDVGTSTLMRMKLRDRGESKNTVTVELHYTEIDITPLSNDNSSDGCDMLKQKVNELIRHLKRKIRVLGTEQTTIEEESAINDELGSSLVKKVAEKVRPIEATKFRTYIDDVGHITSLLLSLSERLARAENNLIIINENSSEKKVLESKRDRLLEQLEEAKRLKGDIDRRGCGLTGMLEKNLNPDDFADFDYFINMKAKLIADSRDITDKIKCGEEQLNALSETLLQSDC